MQPRRFTDGTIRYGNLATTGEPNNLEEALKNKNWKHAMDEEYLALMENKTWHLEIGRASCRERVYVLV